MSIQHSPEPWTQGTDLGADWTRIYSSGTEIARVLPIHPIGHRQKGDFEIVSANARLMTAAPKLLKACQAIVDLENGQGRRNLPMVAGQARAAIAEAIDQDREGGERSESEICQK